MFTVLIAPCMQSDRPDFPALWVAVSKTTRLGRRKPLEGATTSARLAHTLLTHDLDRESGFGSAVWPSVLKNRVKSLVL